MSQQKKLPIVKRLYASPAVQIYGSIRTITQAVGSKGKDDNGTVGGNKTSLK